MGGKGYDLTVFLLACPGSLNWVQQESWKEIIGSKSMAELFSETVKKNIDKICPVEEVKISQLKGKISSLALQRLVRQKKCEYEKHGCSKKFKDLKKKVTNIIKKEADGLD